MAHSCSIHRSQAAALLMFQTVNSYRGNQTIITQQPLGQPLEHFRSLIFLHIIWSTMILHIASTYNSSYTRTTNSQQVFHIYSVTYGHERQVNMFSIFTTWLVCDSIDMDDIGVTWGWSLASFAWHSSITLPSEGRGWWCCWGRWAGCPCWHSCQTTVMLLLLT